MKEITRMDCIIKFEALEEDTQVRGNALASGDDKVDKFAEDEIIARLDDGDIFAWFCAKVTVWFGPLKSEQYLGGCSYESEDAFVSVVDGYYTSMIDEGIEDIKAQVKTLLAKLEISA